MAYTPHTWALGYKVTHDDMTRIEQGIATLDSQVTALTARVAALEGTSTGGGGLRAAALTGVGTLTAVGALTGPNAKVGSVSLTGTGTLTALGSNGALGPQGIKPTRANTGYRNALTTDTSTSLSTPNVTYTNINFTSTSGVQLYASGVTFIDCKITGLILNNTNNTKLVHCYIGGFYTEGHQNTELDHCFLGDQVDTFMQISCGSPLIADGLNVHDCLFDGLQASTGTSHIQAVHLMGVNGATFRNTVFSAVPPDAATLNQMSSVFQFESNFNGRIDQNVTIDGCWFYGGSQYMQIAPTGPGLVVTNNAFTTTWAGGGNNGNIVGIYPAYVTPVTQFGNVIDGTTPMTFP